MDYAAARFNMVEGQIKPNKVTDFALLNAMANVPRELFVPNSMRGIAYVDEDIRISEGRYLVEPMVLARLIDQARVGRSDENKSEIQSLMRNSSAVICYK